MPTPPDATLHSNSDELLDPVAALNAAIAKGFKSSVILSNPVRCPVVAPPTGDFEQLRATGPLAPFVVDIDGFLRADIGIAEAVALLGPPVLCSREPDFGHGSMYLLPRAPHVREVYLETHDADLIGIVLELEQPATVDVEALGKRHGKVRPMSRFHGPHGDVIAAKTPAFQAQLMYEYDGYADPPTARRVRQIIYRRTAMIAILPERFQTVADLARLVRFALRDPVPDTVSFYGTLGVFDKIVGDRVLMNPAIAMRNVASAWIDKRTVGKRHLVRQISVTFGTPIAGDAAELAAALGGTVSGNAVVLPGGTVRIDGAGAITVIAIGRN